MAFDPSRTQVGFAGESARRICDSKDNAVFEAGYFIGIKGKRTVLVLKEQGAKMPADLGGDVYAALEDRQNIGSIEETLRRFTLGP